jgi:hypothetical protein
MLEKLADWGLTYCEAMEVARVNLEEATAMHSRIGENLHCFTSGVSGPRSLLSPRI